MIAVPTRSVISRAVLRVLRALPLAAVLSALVVEAASAITIGRPRGLAVISRALDMPIAARVEPGEVLRPDCVSADVFFGDRRLAPSDARVLIERNGEAADFTVRVRTRSLVDEPVVTVFLQAGCDAATTRRYVFLAEPPPVLEPPGAPVGAPSAAALPSVTVGAPPTAATNAATAAPAAAPALPPAGTRSANTRASPKPDPATRIDPAEAVAKPERRQPSAAVGKVPVSQAKPERARLKLEPLDLSTDRPLGLKSSPMLAAEPGADSPEVQQRRQAARELWAAVNSTPEERVSQFAKLDQLDKRVTNLAKQVAQAEQRAVQSGVQLEAAKAERYQNPLVYALFALVAALAAVAAWLGLKQREVGRRWWQSEEVASVVGDLTIDPDSGPGAVGADPIPSKFGVEHKGAGSPTSMPWRRKLWTRGEAPVPSAVPQSSPKPLVAPGVDGKPSLLGGTSGGLEVDSVSPSSFDQIDRASSASSAQPSGKVFRKSATTAFDEMDIAAGGARRAVSVDELLDAHQQVEFFVTLGQYDQAAALLRSQLEVAPDSSALLYLDLLDLYRQAGNEQDYLNTKEQMEQRFAVKAPEWGDSGSGGRTLEQYSQAVARIEALWPSPKVLTVIEESLLRRPESPEQAFDLPAYRELLMLYAVASDIIVREARAASESAVLRPVPYAEPDSAASSAPAEIDLPLEFGDSGGGKSAGFQNTNIEPLQASTDSQIDSSPPEHLDVDLDLSVLDSIASSGTDMAPPHDHAPARHEGNLIEFADPSIDSADVFDKASRRKG